MRQHKRSFHDFFVFVIITVRVKEIHASKRIMYKIIDTASLKHFSVSWSSSSLFRSTFFFVTVPSSRVKKRRAIIPDARGTCSSCVRRERPKLSDSWIHSSFVLEAPWHVWTLSS